MRVWWSPNQRRNNRCGGNTYFTGNINVTTLPTTPNAFQPSLPQSTCFFLFSNYPCTHAFVVKLNAAGNVVWATYLGGNGADSGSAIAVDAGGDVLVPAIPVRAGLYRRLSQQHFSDNGREPDSALCLPLLAPRLHEAGREWQQFDLFDLPAGRSGQQPCGSTRNRLGILELITQSGFAYVCSFFIDATVMNAAIHGRDRRAWRDCRDSRARSISMILTLRSFTIPHIKSTCRSPREIAGLSSAKLTIQYVLDPIDVPVDGSYIVSVAPAAPASSMSPTRTGR